MPATILSRVQKFVLRKITIEELVGRLKQICKAEKIEADDAALEIVARRGEGSVRDALSILDQIIAFGGRKITAADVATVLGLSDEDFFARLLTLVSEGNAAGIIEALNEAGESGRDFKLLFRDLLNFVRNMLLASAGAKSDIPAAEEAAKRFSYTEVLRIANLLMRDDDTINRAEHQRMAVEIALLKAATFPRLREIEKAMSGGQAILPAQTGKIARPPQPPQKSVAADLESFLERVGKARPLIAGYLSNAKGAKKDDTITFIFNDQYSADAVGDAREALESIAKEVYGAPTRIAVETETKTAAPKEQPLREDPVLKAFQKHLGGEVVESRRSK